MYIQKLVLSDDTEEDNDKGSYMWREHILATYSTGHKRILKTTCMIVHMDKQKIDVTVNL